MKGIIIGFGNMGKTHLERYRQLGVNICAVIENDGIKRQQADSEHIPTFNSLSEVPDLDDIGFIDICTPTNFHFRNLLDAMFYRKPIFVEKPIVLTNEEAAQLRRIEYHHPIFVGEVEQYNPDLEKFMRYEGRPRVINMSRRVNLEFFLQGATPWFLDESLSGGIVLDTMIHDINLLVTKYGKPQIREVVSRAKRYRCQDEVEAKLSFGELEANLYCTWTAEDLLETPIVVDIEVIEKDGNPANFHCDNYIIRGKPKEKDAFYMEFKAFLDSIREGRTPYGLESYLVGIEVANEIRGMMVKT